VLDFCVVRFMGELDEDAQIRVKSAMKNYCRVYPFFASIMTYESEMWEKYFIFYLHLVKKLPKLKRDDFTEGLLEMIDFDKYRLVKEEERAIALQDKDAKVDPVPLGTGGGVVEAELDKLANIIVEFNDKNGGINWNDLEEARRQIRMLPKRLLAYDDFFANSLRFGDWQTSQILLNESLSQVVAALGNEKLEFMHHYMENERFRWYVNRQVYQTCEAIVRERAAPTENEEVRQCKTGSEQWTIKH